jgi:hypothetical protein
VMVADQPARALMAARAYERARELTWPRSARAVLAALREAARKTGPAPIAVKQQLHHAGVGT